MILGHYGRPYLNRGKLTPSLPPKKVWKLLTPFNVYGLTLSVLGAKSCPASGTYVLKVLLLIEDFWKLVPYIFFEEYSNGDNSCLKRPRVKEGGALHKLENSERVQNDFVKLFIVPFFFCFFLFECSNRTPKSPKHRGKWFSTWTDKWMYPLVICTNLYSYCA